MQPWQEAEQHLINCQHRMEGYMNNANLSLILCRWYSFRWNAYQADQCSTSWAGDCLLHTFATWDCIQHSVPLVQLHLQREAVSVQAIFKQLFTLLISTRVPPPCPPPPNQSTYRVRSVDRAALYAK